MAQFPTCPTHTLANVVQIPGAIDLPPGRHAVVASRLSGTIARIAIDRDQIVHAGDVIAEVASLELQNLQLDLLRGHLDMELQEQILERLRPLSEAAAVPRRRLREAQSAHNAACLRRASARRKLIAAGLTAQQVVSARLPSWESFCSCARRLSRGVRPCK